MPARPQAPRRRSAYTWRVPELVTLRTKDALPRVVPADASSRMRVLGRRGRRALTAIAEALFAADQPPPRDRIEWCLDEVDDFLAGSGARTRFVFRLSLFVVSWLAPLLVLALPTIASRTISTRQRALERFEHSVLGLMLLAIKGVLCLVWFEHPEVLASMHLSPSCREDP